MRTKKLFILMMALSGIGLSAGTSVAQDVMASPTTNQIGVAKTQMEPALILLNSRGAQLADGKLVLSGIAANSIMFADRPVRAAGHVLTAHLVEEWAAGSNSFVSSKPPGSKTGMGMAGYNG